MVEWMTSSEPVDYPIAVHAMEERVGAIRSGHADEAIWLLEHPAIYTCGPNSRQDDLLKPQTLPVFRSGRGGQYTYHGPGQRVVYTMLDLATRGRDLRTFVSCLEAWMVATLDEFGVKGHTRRKRIGVWVESGRQQERKIGAIGVRVRKWVSYHGMSINVSPDLSHYDGIVACGLEGYGATSMQDLGVETTMGEVDSVLRKTFGHSFHDLRG